MDQVRLAEYVYEEISSMGTDATTDTELRLGPLNRLTAGQTQFVAIEADAKRGRPTGAVYEIIVRRV